MTDTGHALVRLEPSGRTTVRPYGADGPIISTDGPFVAALDSPSGALVRSVLRRGLRLNHGVVEGDASPGTDPSPGAWLGHNVSTLALLNDAEVRELVTIPSHAPGYRRWGGCDGPQVDGPAMGQGMAEVWASFREHLGPLPWPRVDIYVGPHDWPLGLSFPGVVLLSHRLLASPARARWLYLTHELVHQWYGNALRFADGTSETWERWVDAIAWTLVEGSRGAAVGRVFGDLFERYVIAGGDLAATGTSVLQFRSVLSSGGVALVAPVPLLAGVRRIADPPADRNVESNVEVSGCLR